MDIRVVMGYVANSMLLGVSKQWAKILQTYFCLPFVGKYDDDK